MYVLLNNIALRHFNYLILNPYVTTNVSFAATCYTLSIVSNDINLPIHYFQLVMIYEDT